MDDTLRKQTWDTLVQARYAHLYFCTMASKLQLRKRIAVCVPVAALGTVAAVAIAGKESLGSGALADSLGVLLLAAAAVTLVINHLGYPDEAVRYRIHAKQIARIAASLQLEFEALDRCESTSKEKLACLQTSLAEACSIVAGLPRQKVRDKCWNMLMDELGQPDHKVSAA